MTIKTPAIDFRKEFDVMRKEHFLCATFILNGEETHIQDRWYDEDNYSGLEEEKRADITQQILGLGGA